MMAWPQIAVRWCVHPLVGDDGRLSWSKLVLAAVLTIYAFARPLPTTVAVTAILASYGSKVLLRGLALIQVKLAATDAIQLVRARIESARGDREPSLYDKHWEDA